MCAELLRYPSVPKFSGTESLPSNHIRTTMKTFLVLTLLAALSFDCRAAEKLSVGAATVVERGANHRVLQRSATITNSQGKVSIKTNSYTEVSSGMHRKLASGKWVETSPNIEITPTGAAALNGPHLVEFAANINTAGAVHIKDLKTPNGAEFRSGPVGLAYYDPSTDNMVFVARIKDSVGWLVSSNQIIYSNAFSEIRADIRYQYTRTGIEQDVIIRENVAPPEAYGISPSNAYLQIVTEFSQAPVPSKKERGSRQRSSEKSRADLVDERLDFGGMRLALGKGFSLGADGKTSAPKAVKTQWITFGSRTFLIESLKQATIAASLHELPAAGSLAKDLRAPPKKSLRNQILASLPRSPSAGGKTKIQVAKTDRQKYEPAFVWDYIMVSSDYSMTFESDKTYVVSAGTYINNIAFQGGTVVKYSPGAFLDGEVQITSGPFRPVTFTAVDDDSVGEFIWGSTGTPSGYYADPALQTEDAWEGLEHCRVSYANVGFSLVGPGNRIRHSQFAHNNIAIRGFQESTEVNLGNVLLYDTAQVFAGTNLLAACENVTIDQVTVLGTEGGSASFVNSLLTSFTIGDFSYSFDHTEVVANPGSVFQGAGGGLHYLADDTYRFAGVDTVSIAGEIKSLTTRAPSSITANISASTTLSPQIQKDTSCSELGYHYDPIDYLIGEIHVSNATLTLTNGVGIGVLGSGFVLESGAQIHSEGLPQRLNRIAHINAFQEESGVIAPSWNFFVRDQGDCSATFRFTDFCAAGSEVTAMYLGAHISSLLVRDSQFRGAGFIHYLDSSQAGQSCNFLNNLVEQTQFQIGPTHAMAVATVKNCLFYFANVQINDGTQTPGDFYWSFVNNVFDGTSIAQSSTWHMHSDYNGYRSSYVPRLAPGGHEVIDPNFGYQSGAFGKYYLYWPWYATPVFLNGGAGTGGGEGLFHYTTTIGTGQEGNSRTDVGLHYVAMQGDGVPQDSDGDGIPDYIEDKNGNGFVDVGETSWINPDTDGDGLPDGWEVRYGLNPLVYSRNDDPDGDGVSNYEEYIQGRNPIVGGVTPDINNLLIQLNIFTP